MASDSESGLERQLKVPHIHTVLTEAAETHTLSLSLSRSLSLSLSVSLALSMLGLCCLTSSRGFSNESLCQNSCHQTGNC